MDTYISIEKILPCRNDTKLVAEYDIKNLALTLRSLRGRAEKEFRKADYLIDIKSKKNDDTLDTILLSKKGYKELFFRSHKNQNSNAAI
jgi:hypothetical protein